MTRKMIPSGYITTVTATDKDDPFDELNARITYSLVQNVQSIIDNGKYVYAIDSTTGVITANTQLQILNSEEYLMHRVFVQAQDGGGLKGREFFIFNSKFSIRTISRQLKTYRAWIFDLDWDTC